MGMRRCPSNTVSTTISPAITRYSIRYERRYVSRMSSRLTSGTFRPDIEKILRSTLGPAYLAHFFFFAFAS